MKYFGEYLPKIRVIKTNRIQIGCLLCVANTHKSFSYSLLSSLVILSDVIRKRNLLEPLTWDKHVRSLFSDRNSFYRIKMPEPFEVLAKIQIIRLERCNIPKLVVTYEIILTY